MIKALTHPLICLKEERWEKDLETQLIINAPHGGARNLCLTTIQWEGMNMHMESMISDLPLPLPGRDLNQVFAWNRRERFS